MTPRRRARAHPAGDGASRTLLPALAHLPGHLFWRAHARVQVVLAEELPADVDVHAWATLLALADGQARSQQSLAERTKVSRTTMTKVAADLVHRGLVERVRNPEDRRSYALTRTPQAAGAVRRWAPHVAALEEAMSGAFIAAERVELRALLVAVAGDEIPHDVPGELLESTGFLVNRVHARMHRDFLTTLEPLGIEPRHVGSLVALSALGPVSQTDLARAMGLSPTSVVQIVDELETATLVERRRLPADRRTQVLHLSAGAPGVVAEATRHAADVADTRFAPLTAAQRDRLLDLVRRFVLAP